MALQDIFSGINDLLKQTSDFAGEVMGSVTNIRNVFDPPDPVTPAQTTPANNTYEPNIDLSDYLTQPNWYLLIGGAALLIVALVLSKR